jgi:hypothetical protein
MKSRCFRGHVSGCSKNNILKSRIQFCSHECLLAEAQLVAWLWEGMWLWHCPQNHNENVFISKKMRHKQAILVVSVWKQSAYYFFCYLTFGVIQSPLSQDLGQRLFHVRSLVLLYTKIQFVMNCLLVLPYLKFLGHYLRRTLLKNCGYSNMRALGLLVMSKQNFKSSKCQKSIPMITL